MPLTNGAQFRFTEEQKRRVQEIAEASGLRRADIIRMAVQALIDYYDNHGNRLLLPLRFTETFRVYSSARPKERD